MKNFANAEWNEAAGYWEVFVTDGNCVGKFRVVACDEWVIPLAELAWNGIDVDGYLEDGWYVTEI